MIKICDRKVSSCLLISCPLIRFLPVILVLLVFGSIVGFEKILNQIDDCTCWLDC